MSTFYSSLTSFSEFTQFTDEAFFVDVPSDWSVVITDIKGSTKAIAEGRYKDVNTIGAASIIVVRKCLKEFDFPFVFGGDGATILIPNSHVVRVCEDLAALKDLSVQNFGLELRVGVVEVSHLNELGHSLEVGKFELTAGRSIAILRGEGLSVAEKLIKSDASFEYKETSQKEVSLEGLSCRWNPIPSRRGQIFTILAVSRKGDAIYTQIMEKLSEIFPDGLESANPVNIDLTTYKSVGQLLSDERKLHDSIFSLPFLLRTLEIVFAVLVFKYNFPAIFFNAKKYSNSMQTHSDFRKFDDTLRMVLDCTQEEIDEIKNFLEEKFLLSELFYGTFETASALMTCFVEGLGQGQHIHFIDSENGGYASAAIGLKKQMKVLAER